MLFRSARASCTTSGVPVRTYAMKIWTPIYRHICLMNHQETPQTNPLAIWDPLDVSLNPLGPPGTPWPPPSPPWDPKRDLLASLNSKNHLNCLTYHLRTHQISLLILWDILTLLLETLRP